MKLENVVPYLPTPIAGAVKVWNGSKDAKDAKYGPTHNKNLVFNGVLAAAGYVVASMYASHAGLDLTKVALITTVALPNVAKLAVGGHIVYKGLTEAAVAGAKREWTSIAKGLALAAFGYFANTPKYHELYMTHVFKRF